MNHNFTDKAILFVETQDQFVVFKTYDVIHHYSRRIYLTTNKILAWIEDDDFGSYEERDIHSSVRMDRYHDQLSVELTSITEHDGELTGFIHRFFLDPGWLVYALSEKYTETKLLITVREMYAPARIIIPKSTHTYIRDLILHDKKLKRAFIKAVSRSFMYGKQSVVTLHPDYDGFFFQEERGICGGLIPCEKKITGADGEQHTAVQYSIHT